MTQTSINAEHAENLAEMVMASIKGASKSPELTKSAFIAASTEIYGSLELDTHESAEAQMGDMGLMISVLLWKLAEARGYVE